MEQAFPDGVLTPLRPRSYWKNYVGKVDVWADDKWYVGEVDKDAAVINGKYLVWWDDYEDEDGMVRQPLHRVHLDAARPCFR